jgi:hypothetical protein
MPNDDELLTGRPGLNAEAGYEPMAPDPRMPQEDDDKETIYSSDKDGIEEAARDLSKSRGQEHEIIEREYRHLGGENHGEKVEPN